MQRNVQNLQEYLNQSTFWVIGLVVALILLAVVVHRIRNWYRDGDDPADECDKIIRDFQEMNQQGDLSDEEFRSIKGQISARSNR